MNVNDDNIKIILDLLEKAEQILSIINLSEPIIRKYNHLKELTFDKLGIEFKPLVKKSIDGGNNLSNQNKNLNESQALWEILFKLRTNNIRKNLVIEFLLELIEKFKFEGNVYMKQLHERDAIFQRQMEKLLNYSSPSLYKNIEDLEFDLKLEDIKLKDYIGKSEITYKKFLANLKYSKEKSFMCSSNFNTSDDSGGIEEIVKEYERKFEELKRSHEKEIKEYRERFNELKIKYNPELEKEFYKLKDQHDDALFLIEKINEMLVPVYEKYYQKNAAWYENEKIDFKYRELDKINFLICLINKFFVDNKYLIDLVSSLQKEKLSFIEERNLPYVSNTIQKHGLLSEIHEQSKIIETNADNFHQSFEQIVDYINKNFENII